MDGSRGFQPTVRLPHEWFVAERRLNRRGDDAISIGGELAWRWFNRRSATRSFGVIADRGLKPTATVGWSLRDQDRSFATDAEHGFCRGATSDGSRGFQPTVAVAPRMVRRRATIESAGRWRIPNWGRTDEASILRCGDENTCRPSPGSRRLPPRRRRSPFREPPKQSREPWKRLDRAGCRLALPAQPRAPQGSLSRTQKIVSTAQFGYSPAQAVVSRSKNPTREPFL